MYHTFHLFAIVSGAWGAWGSWDTCSRTCGSGMWTRSRSCVISCSGNYEDTETTSCVTTQCPGIC